MVIKVLNLDKCLKKFENISNIDLTPEIKEATRKVQGKAKVLAPVNKDPQAPTGGNLRGSIRARTYKEKQPDVYGIVGTNVHYGIYQEYGTSKMKAQPFMRPALNQERLGIQQSIKKHIRDEIKKNSIK